MLYLACKIDMLCLCPNWQSSQWYSYHLVFSREFCDVISPLFLWGTPHVASSEGWIFNWSRLTHWPSWTSHACKCYLGPGLPCCSLEKVYNSFVWCVLLVVLMLLSACLPLVLEINYVAEASMLPLGKFCTNTLEALPVWFILSCGGIHLAIWSSNDDLRGLQKVFGGVFPENETLLRFETEGS